MTYTTPDSNLLYLTSLTKSGIAGYEDLQKPPLTAGSEVELTQAVASSDGEVLLKAFVSPALGVETIPAGDWTFSIYGAVSAADGVSELDGHLYQRTLAGVETQILTFTTGEIEATTDTPTLYTTTYSTTDAVTTAITDRLVLKMYAKTDYATNITVNLYYLGVTHQSRFTIPTMFPKITGGDMLTVLYDPDYDGRTVGLSTTDSPGLLPTLQGSSDYYMNGAGEWTIPPGGGESSDLVEHTHTGSTDGGLIRLDTITAPTDSTSLDSSTDMHGLLPKLSGSSDYFMDGTGNWGLPSPDGWLPAPGTWTASSDTITITTQAGSTDIYDVGDKLRFKQGGGFKFNYAITVTDTTLTMTGSTDYEMTTDTITDNYYSKAVSPVGFPQWFSLPAPTFTVANYDNGSGGQPVTDSLRFCISGKMCTVHLGGSGVKAGTNATVMIFADTALPPINRTSYTGRSTLGICHILASSNFEGSLIHYTDNKFYSVMHAEITDNVTITDCSFTISYEI
jgi:hypothetical protein